MRRQRPLGGTSSRSSHVRSAPIATETVSPLKPTTAGDANAALRQLTYIDVTPSTGARKAMCLSRSHRSTSVVGRYEWSSMQMS